MAMKIKTKRRIRYHIDHVSRRLRFHSLRPFSRHTAQPLLKGRIICHIKDFSALDGLVEQLQYLVERDVTTFRIYTDRKSYVDDALERSGVKSRFSASVIDFRENNIAESSTWKLIDSYNWTHSHDKWTLILNTGEYFLYPHFRTRTIPDLCQFLSDEHRRSLFSITLDAYAPHPDTPAFVYGAAGWQIDRYGYEFNYSGAHDTDLWHGGFTYRFQETFASVGRKHITRIALQKIGRRSMPSRDLYFALPPKASVASSPHHLSPTGCIVSSACFTYWKARSISLNRALDFEKLTSAPALTITWHPTNLIENGFMNEGQWL